MMTFTPPFARGRRLALFTSAGIAALAISTPAFAQDTDDETADAEAEATPAANNAIVVTGSRIRRDEFSVAEPITVVTAEEVTQSGFNSISDAL